MIKSRFHIIIFFVAWSIGCANKVTPGGGPKDVAPPKVVKTVPEPGQLSFAGKEISLLFDEYVQLKDLSKQVVISPPVSPKPIIQASGKTVKISFEKLADSTTYVISFGKSIVDVNEGNVLENYRFVFSTGALLDTLSVSGRAFDLHTGKPLKNGMASLYRAEVFDTAVTASLPDYFAKCDDNGNFKIENVAEGEYRLMVLSEKNDNMVLDESSEKAGFVTETITLPSTRNYEVWASEQKPASLKIISANFVPPATLVTVFNGNAQGASFSGINMSTDGSRQVFSNESDTSNIFLKQAPEKLPIELVWLFDGVVDTSTYRSRALTETAGGKVKLSFVPGKWDDSEEPACIFSATPIRSFDASLIKLALDSVGVTEKSISISSDSLAILIRRPSIPGNYSVLMDRGAVVDVYGRSSDTVTFQLVIPDEKSRGAIAYTFQNKPKTGSIVQLLNESGMVVRSASCEACSGGSFTMLPPGKYRMRVLEDLNRNGSWDKGDIRKGLQPEWFTYHPTDITVRANWEVEVSFVFK
ncbi:MAG: Ig-like domain-containing domain [Bacteroidota bacterium]